MKLVTASQMREIDRITIEERGIPGIELMELAGRAVAGDVAEHVDSPGSAVILCGRGNNGGDGFIAARYLHKSGWKVCVLHGDIPAEGSGDARIAWERLPHDMERLPLEDIPDLAGYLGQFDVAIDALLGTGATGRPRPPFDRFIEALNHSGIPVCAVDIPSGLHPDQGTAELAVRAWRTVTMGLPKIGMVTADGPDYCGSTRVVPLLFPADLLEQVETSRKTLTMGEAAALLPSRPPRGHKGTFGMVVVAAGSHMFPGAAVLAGLGALRGGCGLVRMLAPRAVHPSIAVHLPESILADPGEGVEHLVPLPPEAWEAALSRATALVIGPGLGTAPESARFLHQALSAVQAPVLLDADALNLLAEHEELAHLLRPDHVLTPHPGELGRLLKRSVGEIEEDRWRAAGDAAARFGCVVVLKGRGTLVAEPGGRITHVGAGNTALARGGAGDVLSGLMGSLMAQRLLPAAAARLGAFLHGLAADIAVRQRSSRGLLIREIAAALPEAFRELERHHPTHPARS